MEDQGLLGDLVHWMDLDLLEDQLEGQDHLLVDQDLEALVPLMDHLVAQDLLLMDLEVDLLDSDHSSFYLCNSGKLIYFIFV